MVCVVEGTDDGRDVLEERDFFLFLHVVHNLEGKRVTLATIRRNFVCMISIEIFEGEKY